MQYDANARFDRLCKARAAIEIAVLEAMPLVFKDVKAMNRACRRKNNIAETWKKIDEATANAYRESQKARHAGKEI